MAHYTVKYQFRDMQDGKPKGGWRYHELLATDDKGQAIDFLMDLPEDTKFSRYVLQITR